MLEIIWRFFELRPEDEFKFLGQETGCSIDRFWQVSQTHTRITWKNKNLFLLSKNSVSWPDFNTFFPPTLWKSFIYLCFIAPNVVKKWSLFICYYLEKWKKKWVIFLEKPEKSIRMKNALTVSTIENPRITSKKTIFLRKTCYSFM